MCCKLEHTYKAQHLGKPIAFVQRGCQDLNPASKHTRRRTESSLGVYSNVGDNHCLLSLLVGSHITVFWDWLFLKEMKGKQRGEYAVYVT